MIVVEGVARRGLHFVNKGTLLRFSLSTCHRIESSVANQKAAFTIAR